MINMKSIAFFGLLSVACSSETINFAEGTGGQAGAAGAAGAAGVGGMVCDRSKSFSQPTPIAELVSGQDGVLRLSPDLLTAYWMSTRAGGAGNLDLYSAVRVNSESPFTGITNLSVLNSAAPDVLPTVAGDGLSIFFESGRSGASHLYMASRSTTALDFGVPALMANVNSSVNDGNPFVRQDGQVLYFESDRAGTPDIYRATWDGSAFVSPTAVDEINTPGGDGYPAVTPNDLTIYWASSRSDGGAKGNLDIWTATRGNSDEAFANMRPVVELNSAAGEVPSFVTADDCTLFVSSDAVYAATRGSD